MASPRLSITVPPKTTGYDEVNDAATPIASMGWVTGFSWAQGHGSTINTQATANTPRPAQRVGARAWPPAATSESRAAATKKATRSGSPPGRTSRVRPKATPQATTRHGVIRRVQNSAASAAIDHANRQAKGTSFELLNQSP